MSIPTYPLSPTSTHDRRLQRDRFAQAREKGARDQAYADLHHLTQLPDSIRHFPHKSYSTSAIEQALQSKINQHTSRDSDRFRQVLKLFKAQVERESESDDECLWITREQFGTVLSLLGLFATREQADELFDKYDLNGNGQLTVFEFLQRSRPKDYIGEHWAEPESTSLGKKQAHSRTGRGDPPRTPSESVYRLSVERLCNHLRQKLEINKSVGETSSRPRARRELSQLFEYYDKDGLNYVDAEGLRRVLENVNFILGSSHRTTLLSAFPGPKEATFDYPAFILHVYPDQPIQTSLYLTSDTLDVPRAVSPRASSPRASSPRASSPRASASPRATTPRGSSLAIPSSSEGKRVSSPRAVSPRNQTTLPPLPQPVVAVTSQRAITPRGRGL